MRIWWCDERIDRTPACCGCIGPAPCSAVAARRAGRHLGTARRRPRPAYPSSATDVALRRRRGVAPTHRTHPRNGVGGPDATLSHRPRGTPRGERGDRAHPCGSVGQPVDAAAGLPVIARGGASRVAARGRNAATGGVRAEHVRPAKRSKACRVDSQRAMHAVIRDRATPDPRRGLRAGDGEFHSRGLSQRRWHGRAAEGRPVVAGTAPVHGGGTAPVQGAAVPSTKAIRRGRQTRRRS